MPIRLASCSCGQLTAEARGEPVRISICHCLACQRRTGSVFGEQARFPRDQVTITGRSTIWSRMSDAGRCATFYFCPICGTTVHYELEGLENFVAIPVGAFADPSFPTPWVSIYENHKHGWVVLPLEAEHIP